MMSNTEMMLGTCGSVNKLTTTDDWATYTTGTTLASSQNAGLMYDPAGYLNITENQVNVNSGETLVKFRGTVVVLEMWTMMGNDIYTMDYLSANPRRIFKYVGAGSGQTIFSVTNRTVTFNANGGTGAMNAQSASSATALTANSFALSGSTFSGWNTAANGSGTSYADQASYSFAANITLYAQWSGGQIQNNQINAPAQVANSLTAVNKWQVSSCGASANLEIIVEGRGLSAASVKAANSKATVISATDSVLKLQLSEITAAVNWIRISATDALITLQDAFECASQTTASTMNSAKVFFAPNSSVISASEAKRIRALFKSFVEPSAISIVGSTSGSSITKTDQRLAAARSKATATLIRSIFKNTSIQISNTPAAGLGGNYRSAQITFTSSKR
jgi:ribosomal protein L27